ncbi:hypothetical protein J1614_007666 [Plenodomus biglobosus]|nr:hypothetical protein J1614_007666 [Plenodomus biglobosus]
MIFCEEPLGNEPGLGAHMWHQRTLSTSMNRMVRGHTVKCNWLHYAKRVPALWKEVVEKHFRANGDKMLKVAERWAKEHTEPPETAHAIQMMSASRLTNSGMGPQINGITMDIAPILPTLQAALARYGATYVSEKVASTRRGQMPSSYQTSSGGRGGFHGPGYESGYWGSRRSTTD